MSRIDILACIAASLAVWVAYTSFGHTVAVEVERNELAEQVRILRGQVVALAVRMADQPKFCRAYYRSNWRRKK